MRGYFEYLVQKTARPEFWSFTKAINRPVPVAARSKAYVSGRSPGEIVGSNPTGGMDVCLL